MSFTTSTISHTFENADGTAASGVVTFRLTKEITNGATTIMPSEVTATLDTNGAISQALTSNVDPGTVPQDSEWQVDFRIPGASRATFSVVVPVGPGTVDLGSLLPQQTIGG